MEVFFLKEIAEHFHKCRVGGVAKYPENMYHNEDSISSDSNHPLVVGERWTKSVFNLQDVPEE